VTPILSASSVEFKYGQIQALWGIDVLVQSGSITAVLGANGAGKTTLLKVMSGLLTPSGGEVIYDGRSIRGIPAFSLVRSGIAHVPEGRKIFSALTVQENLDLGAYSVRDKYLIAARTKRVLDLFPILEERRSQLGGTLSGGEQQMLAIGRALMISPRVILLDEPSLGIAPIVAARIFETIASIRDEGTTVVLVEQNARRALKIADFAYVLRSGHVVIAAATTDLRSDPSVIDAYLGAV
jgi:branched-chain amino acid transport system ATP-binding protein